MGPRNGLIHGSVRAQQGLVVHGGMGTQDVLLQYRTGPRQGLIHGAAEAHEGLTPGIVKAQEGLIHGANRA